MGEDDSRRTEKSEGPSHQLKPSVVDPELAFDDPHSGPSIYAYFI